MLKLLSEKMLLLESLALLLLLKKLHLPLLEERLLELHHGQLPLTLGALVRLRLQVLRLHGLRGRYRAIHACLSLLRSLEAPTRWSVAGDLLLLRMQGQIEEARSGDVSRCALIMPDESGC